MIAQPGLCRTLSETPKTGFLTTRLKCSFIPFVGKSIYCFTASIISKKAAEMLDTLVLDVKVGKGAFIKDEMNARELASRMVSIFS